MAEGRRPWRLRTIVIALVLTLSGGCSAGDGRPLPECGPVDRSVPALIARPGGSAVRPIRIDCFRQTHERRVRLQVTMPPGPDCHGLERVRLQETADVVAITLYISVKTVAAGGVCSSESPEALTDVELQAPLRGREVRDGNG